MASPRGYFDVEDATNRVPTDYLGVVENAL
jgi:hypothetical protein